VIGADLIVRVAEVDVAEQARHDQRRCTRSAPRPRRCRGRRPRAP
jgi:hypothetical protein